MFCEHLIFQAQSRAGVRLGAFTRVCLRTRYLEYVYFNKIKKATEKKRKKWILNYFLKRGHNVYKLKSKEYIVKGIDFKHPYPF